MRATAITFVILCGLAAINSPILIYQNLVHGDTWMMLINLTAGMMNVANVVRYSDFLRGAARC